MPSLFQNPGKRFFYFARKSALLRRMVALPVFSPLANRIGRRILQPAHDYPEWMQARLARRREMYACNGEPGLLSFLTTVWNTPLKLLRPAVESLLQNQTVAEFQWVLLDNGSSDAEVVRYLNHTVAADARVVFLRVEKNLGIIAGMQLVLSKATGRYVLPFDSDDLLYSDAVAILTHQSHEKNYPPVLYTDEDKLQGNQPCWPYFKPDWDPVLFLSSCYTAHQGCMDRQLAIELGVYTDAGCDGCHDWDAFTRFMQAGHVPVHIPEIVYSWRMHRSSTASNVRSKNYIFNSQRNLLSRYLAGTPYKDKFELRLSPLFQGTPDWWMQRKSVDAMPMLVERINPGTLVKSILPRLADFSGLVCILHESVKLDQPEWPFEVTGLFELHHDAVMIGGRVINSHGKVVEGGRVPGFGGAFGCPDKGRDAADPGNFAEMWKPRSVSGVSTHLCVMRVGFLRQVIEEFSDQPISWFFLGAWAALSAWRNRQRIICTPFLSGISDFDFDAKVDGDEINCFTEQAKDFLCDRRYYSRHLGLSAETAYQPVESSART